MQQKQGFGIRGFARIKIMEKGKLVGDSGLTGSNRITVTGLEDYLVRLLAGDAASLLVDIAQLGSGAEPATDDVRLPASIGDAGSDSYDVVATSTIANSDGITMRWYGTFGSSAGATEGFVTKTHDISNIGLYNLTTSNASLACGQTYPTSNVDTNQDVQYTYEWQIDTTS
jgi:hypothetical protein